MPAGDNERLFRTLLNNKFGAECLKGKRSFKATLAGHSKSVYISVDDSLSMSDGRLVLLEVDSGNYAKLLAGQYALINGLFDGERDKTLFVVVHFYKSKDNALGKEYDPSRTLKNLNAIQSFNPSAQWLPYGAITYSEFSKIVSEASSIDELGAVLWALSSHQDPSISKKLKKVS